MMEVIKAQLVGDSYILFDLNTLFTVFFFSYLSTVSGAILCFSFVMDGRAH